MDHFTFTSTHPFLPSCSVPTHPPAGSAHKPCQAVRADLYISPTTHRIVSPQSHFYTSHLLPSRTIDLGGNLLSPGLIDVQINGAYGVDFSELDLEDEDGGESRYGQGLETVARRIVETGCTSFVPTIITQEEDLYSKVTSPDIQLRAIHLVVPICFNPSC